MVFNGEVTGKNTVVYKKKANNDIWCLYFSVILSMILSTCSLGSIPEPFLPPFQITIGETVVSMMHGQWCCNSAELLDL